MLKFKELLLNVLGGDANLLNVDAPRHDVRRDEDLFHALAEAVQHLRVEKINKF